VAVTCREGQHPDNVIVLDPNGKYLKQINLLGNGGGTPSGLTFGNAGTLLYTGSADSEDIGTQHIQVYLLKTGKLVSQFGGNQCNDQPPDYLCQTFNGLQIVP